jgi:hypothetical protein
MSHTTAGAGAGMQGMDTDHARQVSRQMGEHAGRVAGVCSSLFARLEATAWVGEDKTRCSADLSDHFIPAAQGAARSIEEQARVLTSHADRQDAVSG